MDEIVLQEAVEILLSRTKKIQEKEMISLWEVPGRVLAEDVYAMHSQPPFDRSPLDGYAVRSEDIKDASQINPIKLKVLCEVDAGHVSEEKVREGTAIRIMTGAPISDGADCVIRQEDTDYGEDIVEIYESVGSYENYCFQGEDYKEGTLMMAEGTELTANVELIVRPVLAKLSGRKSLISKKVKAISQSTFLKRSEVTRYVRALYEDGKVRIPNGSNDSGVLSTMRGCNCMIELPAGLPELKEGDEICVVLL